MIAVTGVLLVLFTLGLLLRITIWVDRPLPRAAAFLPLLLPVLIVLHFVAYAERASLTALFALPVYLVCVAQLLCGLPRMFSRSQPAPGAHWRGAKIALGLAGLAVVLITGQRLAALELQRGREHHFASMEHLSGELDLRRAPSWTQAFATLLSTLRREYPFTDHKRIDWAALEREFAPRVAEAERKSDRAAFFWALRGLGWRLRDGHVGVSGGEALVEAQSAGSYGLELVQLDDGTVRVLRAVPGGAAHAAGLAAGATLLNWCGRPIDQAASSASTLGSLHPPATAGGEALARTRGLTRAPVGTTCSVAFRDAGGASHAALLTAAASRSAPAGPGLGQFYGAGAVTAREAGPGVGLIAIRFEAGTFWSLRPEEDVSAALERFTARGIQRVILDVRGNAGGTDDLVPPMVAPLLRGAGIYEIPGVPDPASGQFRPAQDDALRFAPRPPLFDGQVVVLIDEETVSSGEGIPLLLQGLRNVTVVGWHGTHGSFGIDQKTISLPAGLGFSFPLAQSLDARGRVQVDSDASGKGGLTPDVRPPLDEAALQALAAGRDVLLERALELLAAPR